MVQVRATVKALDLLNNSFNLGIESSVFLAVNTDR
jgi:hypothetical protein